MNELDALRIAELRRMLRTRCENAVSGDWTKIGCADMMLLLNVLNARTAAILWALGLGDDFPPRPNGAGAYWWRTELRKRAALGYGPTEDHP